MSVFHARLTALLVVLVCLGGLQPARAQQGLRVESTVNDSLAAAAGSPTTFSLIVTADSGGTYEVIAMLPEGWRSVIMGGTRFDLKAGERTQRLITFFAARDASAGPYRLSYRVRNANDPAREQTVSVPVVVPAYRALKLSAGEYPSFFVSGSQYTISYRLRNASNVTATVDLSVEGGSFVEGGGFVESGSFMEGESFGMPGPKRRSTKGRDRLAGLTMKPGELRELQVGIRARAVSRRYSHAIRLRAVMSDSVEVEDSRRVDVYPSFGEGRLAYHRFPLVVTTGVSAVTADWGTDTRYRYGASGADRSFLGTDTELSFSLQGPQASGVRTFSQFASRDRYRARLETDRLEVRLGDQSAAGVGTAPGASGFGGLLGYDFGGVDVEAFSFAGRRSFDTGRRQGARLGVGGDGARLEAGYLERTGGFRAGRAWSGNGTLSPLAHLDLQASTAVSSSAEGRGLGYDASASYRRSRFDVRVEHETADEAFLGWNRGTVQTSGAARVEPWAGWALRVGYHHTQRRLGTRERLRSALSLGRHVDLLYEGTGSERTWGGTRTRHWEDVVGTTLQTGTGPLALRANGEVGRFRGTPFRLRDANTELRLQGRWRGASGLQLATTARHRTGRSWPGSPVSTQTSSRLYVSAPLTSAVRVDLGGTYSRFEGRFFSSSSLRGTARLQYSLPSGSVLQLDAGAFQPDGPGTYGVGLAFSQPIGVPMRRDRTSGLLRGRLVNGMTGEGIPDVPVRVNRRAVLTTSDGSFFFAEMPPGDYQLQVDTYRLPPGHLVAEGLPYRVEVDGGEATSVQLTTRKAGSIRGRVSREVGDTIERAVGEGAADADVQPFGGALVEVDGTTRDGTEVYLRRLTDSSGAFQFLGLLAGTYTVRLLPASLPDLHRASPESVVVELEPGQADEVSFLVQPVKRKIQFLKIEDGGAGGGP